VIALEAPATVQPSAVPRNIDELTSSVSASRVSLFHQCRLKFYFRYVLGLFRPKSPGLHVGSSDHAVLKFWNKARWRGEQPTLKQLHDVYSNSWAAEQQARPVDWTGENQEEEKKTGWRLLETYFRESPIRFDEKPEAVEVSVEADLSKRGLPKLVGIIDLVRPGGRIVDFKTAGKSPDPATVGHLNETQLASYGVLYRHGTGKKESALQLHHLIKTRHPKLIVTELPPVSDAQENRLYRVMESYLKGVQAEDWVPSPSFLCGGCEFFNECRAWH
jgi:CRISPR/Cas system-associated exonuclease Cas4 (RecB family)